MRRHERTTKLLSAMLFAALLGLLAPASVQAQKRPDSRQLIVSSPDRTDAGEWSGTWFFQTRSDKWALWMRVTDGVPEMMFQYMNRDRAETFKTDWQSVARYAHHERAGVFQLSFTRRDENVIEGEWFWQLGTEEVDSSIRAESAKIRIYRAGMGRQMVVRFEDYERVYSSGDEDIRMEAIQAWTFHQSSRRLVEWSELPF